MVKITVGKLVEELKGKIVDVSIATNGVSSVEMEVGPVKVDDQYSDIHIYNETVDISIDVPTINVETMIYKNDAKGDQLDESENLVPDVDYTSCDYLIISGDNSYYNVFAIELR